MPATDYYAVLQVQPDAEPEVIQAAYRRLAAKYHPDVNRQPQATERMVQLNTAYEVLSNPARRADYDAARRARSTTWAAPAAPQHSSHVQRVGPRWLFLVGLLALVVALFRVGLRVMVPLLVILLVVWVLWAVVRPRQ